MRFWKQASTRERDFEDVLADGLEEVNGRRTVDEVLSRYPDYAPRLEPLLRTKLLLQDRFAIPMRENRRIEARRRFLQAAARQSREAPAYVSHRLPGDQSPAVILKPLWSAFAPAIVAAVFFVVALVPIMGLTSSNALPGDWNYGFKRSSERVRLALTTDPTQRLNLQLSMHQQRLGEIERLAAAGRLHDPMLIQTFSNETEQLVQTVRADPALGPSEALKVAAATEAQAQVLQDKIEPSVQQPAVRDAVAAAVDQSQQSGGQAAQVAQAKTEASARRQAQSATGTPTPSALIPSGTTATAMAVTPTATPTPGPSSSPTAAATPAASSATASVASSTPLQSLPLAPIQPPPAPVSRPAPIVPPSNEPSAPTTGRAGSGSTTQVNSPAVRPIAEATPSPAASTREASAPLVPPVAPPATGPRYTYPLLAGVTTYIGIYQGPTLPMPEALATITGAYDAVYFTQPQERGDHVYTWVPGSNTPPPVLEHGSQFSIHTKPGTPAVLSYIGEP